MNINNFNKIFCLHCVDNKERYITTQQQFKKIGILDKITYRLSTLQPASNIYKILHLHNDAEYHCTREHYTMIKMSYLLNYDYILIFEDDIKLIKKDLWDIFMNNIPDNFDILRLMGFGPNKYHYEKLFNNEIYWTPLNQQLWSTGAYALSRKGMKYYMNYIEKQYCQADVPLYDITSINKNQLNCYISTLPLSHFYEYTSTIQKKDMNELMRFQNMFYNGINKEIYE